MKKKTMIAAALMMSAAAFGQTNPLWLRHSAISPDGKTIAFCYQGDIFTVPAEGGRAVQLTTNPAYDTNPVWSPDGRKIAFASDRNGNFDVFLMDHDGGRAARLTTNSAGEIPMAFRDNDHLLYKAWYMPTAEDAQFPSPQYTQVYEVETKEGRRPKLFSEVTMEDVDVMGDKLLYHDKKGGENAFRKHHTSSVTRDVWKVENINGERKFTKMTNFEGEDRNPVWSPDGRTFFYLSETDGSYNVYKMNADGSGKKQITHFKKHPVRYLSEGAGTLCFGFDGRIYTMKEGQKPHPVDVTIKSDKDEKDVYKTIRRSGATDFDVSPGGKEIAFILHGDVYVTSIEYNTTRQITDTPQQERDIQFSPDGRSLVYSGERDGFWQIYQSSIVDKDEKSFTYATKIKEERLTNSKKTSFQPQYSPDGKEVAFLEDRAAIKVVNLKSKKVRTVMPSKYQYSYQDGDQSFEWSPDSKWILTGYFDRGGWNNGDLAVINASGNGEIHNITHSGYVQAGGKWVLGGKAIIFASDYAGYRSHGSWGAERDEYIMFFDLDAYDKFLMNKEDLELLKKQEKEEAERKKAEAEKKNKKNKKGKKDDKKKKKDEVKPLKLDFEHADERVVRLTVNSSHLGDAYLTNKGDKLYYCASFEGKNDLWMHDLKDDVTSIVIKGLGARSGLVPSKDGSKLYVMTRGGITEINLASGKRKGISFEAPFNYRPAEERQYMFDHVWQQVQDKFYDPKIHGIDWKGYKKAYQKFLPYINNNRDFSDLLSELLGELNASHTGSGYFGGWGGKSTASLGLFFDNDYKGDGLKVKEVVDRGPFARRNTGVVPGCIIEKLDGEQIKAGKDYFPMLEDKAGKKMRVEVRMTDGKTKTVTIRPISKGALRSILYKRWIETNKRKVNELSNGRIAYVHVAGMDSKSFRHVYSELLGEDRNREAVIVDTRHNGGGWLHDDLCNLLSGEQYVRFAPRGQYIGHEPFAKWCGPSCVLIGEDNYSDASGFPQAYRSLKIGKLVGAPTPGTMTAVWWETLLDPTVYFGIPQVGCMDNNDEYYENQQIEPDILIYNNPQKFAEGVDDQLSGAVRHMLKEADKNKKK